MKLYVIESPNKMRDIKRYLERLEPGAWDVVATVGHWRGLPEMEGREFEDVASPGSGFREAFELLDGKRDVVARLKRAIQRADEVYLATDGDREGEAIAWHVEQFFALKSARRALTNEITERGIRESVAKAKSVNYCLVDAQRARALLDYLIGMEVSRLLWRFGAKSAGRLQSCALRCIVDREIAIEAFQSSEYWKLVVDYAEGFQSGLCVLQKPDAEDAGATDDTSQESRWVPQRITSAHEAARYLEQARSRGHRVERLETKPTIRNPPSPFTTSSLLGEAASALQFTAEKTTRIAQALFEKGHVTYIRTDSVAIGEDAASAVRDYLAKEHEELVPKSAHRQRSVKSAQGAHEAIRPTVINGDPSSELSSEERELYALIFERTLCSQAKPAAIERTDVTIAPDGVEWRLMAQGVVIKEAGWLRLASRARADEMQLPPLQEGQELRVSEARSEKSKTRPPARYNERTLILHLERKGVGRPSTYAAMLTTLRNRGYVEDKGKGLAPEGLGRLADRLVRLGFDELSREEFTAKTEAALDAIAAGKIERVAFLEKLYRKFQQLKTEAIPLFDEFARKHPEMDRDAVNTHGQSCSKCGAVMHVRVGKSGQYARCSSSECGHAISLEVAKEHRYPCPKCGERVAVQSYRKEGKARKFYRCLAESCAWKSNYPPPRVAKALCPNCGGRMLLKKGPKGEFWGCAQYPNCGGSLAYAKPRARKS